MPIIFEPARRKPNEPMIWLLLDTLPGTDRSGRPNKRSIAGLLVSYRPEFAALVFLVRIRPGRALARFVVLPLVARPDHPVLLLRHPVPPLAVVIAVVGVLACLRGGLVLRRLGFIRPHVRRHKHGRYDRHQRCQNQNLPHDRSPWFKRDARLRAALACDAHLVGRNRRVESGNRRALAPRSILGHCWLSKGYPRRCPIARALGVAPLGILAAADEAKRPFIPRPRFS